MPFMWNMSDWPSFGWTIMCRCLVQGVFHVQMAMVIAVAAGYLLEPSLECATVAFVVEWRSSLVVDFNPVLMVGNATGTTAV